MERSPSDSYSLTLRVKLSTRAGTLGEVATAIGKAGGDIGAIDLVEVRKKTIVRDLTFKAIDEPHGQQVVERLKAIEEIGYERVMLQHLAHRDLDTVTLIGRELAPAVA